MSFSNKSDKNSKATILILTLRRTRGPVKMWSQKFQKWNFHYCRSQLHLKTIISWKTYCLAVMSEDWQSNSPRFGNYHNPNFLRTSPSKPIGNHQALMIVETTCSRSNNGISCKNSTMNFWESGGLRPKFLEFLKEAIDLLFCNLLIKCQVRNWPLSSSDKQSMEDLHNLPVRAYLDKTVVPIIL